MKNITILGSGSFGCALAHAFSKNNNIKMWSFTKEEKESINNNHKCLLLPSIELDEKIKSYDILEEALKDSDIIIIAVPSIAVRSNCKNIKEYIKNQDILIASKGMEKDILLSDIVKEELNINPSILMGPSLAKEIGEDEITFVELSGNKELIKDLETDTFKISYNEDYIGLEVGGALKNVITLMYGIIEGKGYKLNTKSYVITEGLREIKEIGKVLGANESTFYGLSGIGDLFVTAVSDTSRNKKAGILLGKGQNIDEVKKQVGQTIEGLDALINAKYIMDKYNLDLKIINNLYDFIYNGKDVKLV